MAHVLGKSPQATVMGGRVWEVPPKRSLKRKNPCPKNPRLDHPMEGLVWTYMGVSKNNGTPKYPKSSILIGFSIIFTIHFGGVSPYFWVDTHMTQGCIYKVLKMTPGTLGGFLGFLGWTIKGIWYIHNCERVPTKIHVTVFLRWKKSGDLMQKKLRVLGGWAFSLWYMMISKWTLGFWGLSSNQISDKIPPIYSVIYLAA